MNVPFKKSLGKFTLLPSDKEVLSRVESPPRPVLPMRAENHGRRYPTVFLHAIYDGRKKP